MWQHPHSEYDWTRLFHERDMRDELFAKCLPEEYRRHEERRNKARVKAHKQFELLLHEQRNLGAEYDENRRGIGA